LTPTEAIIALINNTIAMNFDAFIHFSHYIKRRTISYETT